MNIFSIFGKTVEKKTNGTALIYDVIGRFETMIDELNCGVGDCVGERLVIEDEIKSLNERNVILDSSIKKAKAISSNLKKLIGE